MVRKRYLIGIMLGALLFFGGGCHEGKPKASELDKSRLTKTKAEGPLAVKVAEAHLRKATHSMETAGNFFSDKDVVISAEVEGKVREIFFDKGDKVKVGDLLVQVEDEEWRLWAQRSQARLEQARVNLGNAEKTFRRYKDLFEQGIIGKQQYDDTENKLSVAQQDVKNAEAELALSEKKVRDARVISPVEGIVSERFISVGEYAQKNRERGNNLFNIVRIDPLKLYFSVTDKNAARVYLNQKVKVKVRPYPDEEFVGHVDFINPKMDPATKGLRVEARFANPQGKLKPGMFADIFIILDENRDAVFIPEEAVINQGREALVYVVEGEQARRRGISLGMGLDGEVEIVSGLKQGERVVTEGNHRLADGARIKVRN
ncbi:MAG: efflux RND transporter periplasmic adaptor subunit [Nitrospinae bacterium]|nr:efflux RND transporter periplasmic adaptor subunit [Nitrospinota bacterium]